MQESRIFPNDLMKQFIMLYRDNPCLWKIGSREYCDRNLKKLAYKKIVELVRQRYPDADKDFVVKKINNMRGCFRREHYKVLKSKRTATSEVDIYRPSLWYYESLLFCADQKVSRMKESDDDEDYGHFEGAEMKINAGNAEDPLSYCMAMYKPTVSSANINNGAIKIENDTMMNNTFEYTVKDEFDAYGVTIAAKLRKMKDHQRLFAENLINQILFKGMFNKLSVHSFLYECDQTNEQQLMSSLC